MIKGVLRELSPPFLWKAAYRLKLAIEGRLAGTAASDPEAPQGFSGDFSTFAQAVAASKGYESPSLIANSLERTREQRRKYANGDFVEIDWRLLEFFGALLPLIAGNPKPLLRVLDVGGGLGNHYWFAKRFTGRAYDWTVLETPAMATAGAEFSDEHFRFTTGVEQARAHGPFDIVVMSGVLQVLEDPYASLKLFAGMGAHAVIARTHLIPQPADRLTVFNVPVTTFGTPQSFPFWFFSEQKFTQALQAIGTIRLSWTSSGEKQPLDGLLVPTRGFLLDARRKD